MKISKKTNHSLASSPRRSWRAVVALLGLVLVPALIIVPLTWRMVNNEKDVLEMQYRAVVDSRLQGVDRVIQNLLVARAEAFSLVAPTLSLNTDSLRDWLRGQPLLRSVFVMDAKGNRLHPPVNAPISSAEAAFIARTEQLWADKDILYRSQVADDRGGSLPAAAPTKLPASWYSPNESKPNVDQSTDAARASRNTDAGEWYGWHWGTNTHLVFWTMQGQQIVGFELESARLMADMIVALEAWSASQTWSGNEGFVLRDAHGLAVHSWGVEVAGDSAMDAVLPLSGQLSSWRVEFYDRVGAPGGTLPLIMLWAVFLALLGMAALGFYLYRENGRELREAGQRVNFVSRVSHELKTPLTNIRMYAEMLGDVVDADDARGRRYVDVVVAESQRLSRLIGNVLSFSKSEDGQSAATLRKTSVETVVRGCVTTFIPAFTERGIAVKLEGNAAREVWLDVDLVEQVVNNLFSNAEKYAPNGALTVSFAEDGDLISVRVQDQGPGIPKVDQERVFAPFYRVESKLTEGVSGTGIGLGLARDLARHHGGDLRLIDSDSGACFEFTVRAGEEKE